MKFKLKGYVVDIINQSNVVINAGSKDDVQLNDMGEFYIELPILDVKNNINLGNIELPIATFTVYEVYENFCVVIPLDSKIDWEDNSKSKFNIKEDHNQFISKEIEFQTKARILDQKNDL
ncbi:hypothetical protein EII25_06135 [Erysipelotrichaceae bacterium OH741_COT-311]|nr:hypothetical protein EII25_06135 [Erysipelotrichaceae bacterium OH741_COT-311]